MTAFEKGGIIVRAATEDDLPGIVDVWKPFMDHHAAIDPHYTRIPDAHERFGEHLRAAIATGEHGVFVAIDTGAVIGYAKASLAEYPPIVAERRYGTVTDMAVAASHRRHCIGRLLLEACESWLRAKGVVRVEVRVLKGNPDGEGFWSEGGYEDFLLVKWKRL